MPQRITQILHSALRGYPVLIVVIATCTISVLLNPVKLGVLVWLIAKITTGAYAGYWVDRCLHPSNQPDQLTGIEAGTAWKRQGMIVSACIVCAGLLP